MNSRDKMVLGLPLALASPGGGPGVRPPRSAAPRRGPVPFQPAPVVMATLHVQPIILYALK